jgi:hypothetical protein
MLLVERELRRALTAEAIGTSCSLGLTFVSGNLHALWLYIAQTDPAAPDNQAVAG